MLFPTSSQTWLVHCCSATRCGVAAQPPNDRAPTGLQLGLLYTSLDTEEERAGMVNALRKVHHSHRSLARTVRSALRLRKPPTPGAKHCAACAAPSHSPWCYWNQAYDLRIR